MSAAQPVTYPWHCHVPVLGTDQDFAEFRDLLVRSGYSDEGIRKRLKLETLERYSAPTGAIPPMEDALDALIRLFFDCGFVMEAAVMAVLPEGSIGLLDRLGLLVRHEDKPGVVFAAAAILPAFGVLTVCDRGEHAPDGTKTELPSDVVYPAILDTTRRFIESLPFHECDAMLDLGTGTGIAALLAAPEAGSVVATDVTARAVLFAEFNYRLAGIKNMTVAVGDMYAPVAGKTFDRITIHPPYVPAKQDKFVFRDAGQDGEQIIRRAVEGIAGVLRPGGRFHSLQLASDRDGEMFEQRVRKWLGPQHEEFDVVVAAHSLRTPWEFLADHTLRNEVNVEEIRDFIAIWRATKTRLLIYGALLIERHDAPRPAITTRVQVGKGFDGRHHRWLLEWHKAITAPGNVEMLMGLHPSIAEDCALNTVSRKREKRFRMEEFSLKSFQPIRGSFKCDGPVAQIITNCFGDKTWREHFEGAKAAELIPAGVREEEFSKLLGLAVSAGILRVPEYPLPQAGRADEDEDED